MELTTKNWKEFRIGDLFDCYLGKSPNKQDITEIGNYPVISAQTNNNGIIGYTDCEDRDFIYDDKLTLGNRGSYKCFYQKGEFYAGNNVIVFDEKFTMNKFHKLFIVTLINKLNFCGYTKYPTKTNIVKETLLLPSKNDEPDWDFMEEFIKEIEEENKEKLAVLKDVKPVDDEIDISDWHEFRIEDLFDGLNGDFDIKQKHINNKGDIVITSGVENFGILGKTDVKARLINEKTLTIDMFGNVFYRPYKYKMVTHARVFALIPKFDMSNSIGLFMATIFFHLKEKYSYSNMCSFNKIKNEMILLPAKNDEPDWEYMEDFITNQQEKIKNQLKELRR